MLLHPHDRITSTVSDIIYDSVFEFFTYSSFGGAIFIEQQDSSLILERCLFRVCLTTHQGGAIHFSGKVFSTTDVGFVLCSAYTSIVDLYGNAIFCQKLSSSSSNANMTLTTFFCCGPSIEIASDTTAYFNLIPLESGSTNFSHCCNNGGSETILLEQETASVHYMNDFDGVGDHLTCVIGDFKIKVFKSNFINWTQNRTQPVFWGNPQIAGSLTELTDCCIFFNSFHNNLGKYLFLGNCYGNFQDSGIVNTVTTKIFIHKNEADRRFGILNLTNRFSRYNTFISLTIYHLNINL